MTNVLCWHLGRHSDFISNVHPLAVPVRLKVHTCVCVMFNLVVADPKIGKVVVRHVANQSRLGARLFWCAKCNHEVVRCIVDEGRNSGSKCDDMQEGLGSYRYRVASGSVGARLHRQPRSARQNFNT